MAPTSQSTAELMLASQREVLLLAGKDGAGKSTALVAIAKFVQDVLNPAATFFVIDTENKFPTALRSFGDNAPTNIRYFKCEDMNDVTDSTAVVMADRKAHDWLGVESMSRIWGISQDLAYKAISGFDKETYLDKRKELIASKAVTQKTAPLVIPAPDQFWNIAKGAHDGKFLDLIAQASSLNIVLTTTIAKPPKADAHFKENETRKQARVEFGMDAGLDGAPRLPYYAETLVLLGAEGGKVVCQVVRDNVSKADNPKKVFEADGRNSFAFAFWGECRG